MNQAIYGWTGLFDHKNELVMATVQAGDVDEAIASFRNLGFTVTRSSHIHKTVTVKAGLLAYPESFDGVDFEYARRLQ